MGGPFSSKHASLCVLGKKQGGGGHLVLATRMVATPCRVHTVALLAFICIYFVSIMLLKSLYITQFICTVCSLLFMCNYPACVRFCVSPSSITL